MSLAAKRKKKQQGLVVVAGWLRAVVPLAWARDSYVHVRLLLFVSFPPM
jgi:hypothetical protein